MDGARGLAASQWRGPHGAGAAVSRPFLPAVPTVPPGNVQTEATNSTTIRFTWNPPSPQFINGINQGYKVRGDSRGSPRKGQPGWGRASAELHEPPDSSSPKPRILIVSSPAVKIIFTAI